MMLTLIASMIWMPIRPGAFCPSPRFQSSMLAGRSSSHYRVQAIANPLRAPYSRRSRLELWWYTAGRLRIVSTLTKYRRQETNVVPKKSTGAPCECCSKYVQERRAPPRLCRHVPPIQLVDDSYISFTSPWISSFWPFSKQLSMAPRYIFFSKH